MKRLSGLLALAGVVVLGVTPAFAGSSTDAALGLGAFAVFNQILSGTGVFGAGRPVYREVVVAPVVVQQPPAVVYTPPPPVVYAPAPSVVYGPPPVVYAPAPPPAVYYAPQPVYAYRYYRVHHKRHHHDDD